MNDLITEIFIQAASNKVIIDNDEFNIGFNTIIYKNNSIILNTTKNENLPTLIIKNQELFYSKLNTYIETVLKQKTKLPTVVTNKKYNMLKFIISYLFANATSFDFVEPIQFINRNIKFLNDNTFDDFNEEKISDRLDYFQNSSISIKKIEQSLFMETPYKFDISIKKQGNKGTLTYNLPSVSFGITTNEIGEKVCYIYTIQNRKEKKNEKSEEQKRYEKKIGRELYKINAGVFENESEEYKLYKANKSDYYPENISDVSPSAVISASILISLLSSKGITNIKIADFLPVRWYAKDYAITKMLEHNKDLDEEETRERHRMLQTNITDKFLRTFRRLAYHFKGLDIISFPKQVDDFMTIKLNGNTNFNSLIIEDIYFKTNRIENNYKQK